MTFLFSFFTKPGAAIHFAGAPFLLGAILMLGSALIAYYTLKRRSITKAETLSGEPI
jgi:DHA1 family tetracycline resistance protein-like MFS transporter